MSVAEDRSTPKETRQFSGFRATRLLEAARAYVEADPMGSDRESVIAPLRDALIAAAIACAPEGGAS